MIIHDAPQGSSDWEILRLGIPTASEFKSIVQPTTGELSMSKDKKGLSEKAKKYAYRLIAEKLLMRPTQSLDGLEWIERGKELEAAAAKLYEFENDVETQEVGFFTTDCGMIGASPDRLVLNVNGGLEIKCPAPQTHIGYMIDGFDGDYVSQAQGQIYVAELDWVDRYSYHPEMPPLKERTFRDDAYIKNLASALNAFNEIRLEMFEKIRKTGFFAEREKPATIVDVTYQGE